MTLPVSHFEQEYPHTCVVTCIRMVLAYLGQEHSEEELSTACGTVPVWGTRPDVAVAGLERLGYHGLWFENANLERILDLLDQNWPVIVFVRAAELPHGRAGIHAVVVVGIEEKQVICLDPAPEVELRLPLSAFLEVWSGMGNQGMVVWV